MSSKVGCPTGPITTMNAKNCRCLGGSFRKGKCIPPRRKLLVRRDAYTRKPYTRKDGTKVKGAKVPASYHMIKDVGAPGRGPKLIIITAKGALTKYGYSTKLPAKERHRALDKAVKAYGSKRVWRRLHGMVNLREEAGVEGPKPRKGQEKAWGTFRADRNYVKKKHKPNLTPKAAIKKWKGMTHKQRVRARAA